MITDVKLWLVGGAVRDFMIDQTINPKDFDFAVEAESYESMKQWLLESHFEIFLESPEYYTIRARRHTAWFFDSIELSNMTYDFVLCRKDGEYIDGRRPESVARGTILDDLARRDFTMNAIAMDQYGKFLDPYNGMLDIQQKKITCVGGTDRLKEDGLRIIRALRFEITMSGFSLDEDITKFICNVKNLKYLDGVAIERIKDELYKAFSKNSLRALATFSYFDEIFNYITEDTGLWLMPTLKSK